MIFQRFGNMKFAYRNREFWCKGYYVDTVGKNTAAIKSYIANQLKQDQEMDQLSLFDPRGGCRFNDQKVVKRQPRQIVFQQRSFMKEAITEISSPS